MAKRTRNIATMFARQLKTVDAFRTRPVLVACAAVFSPLLNPWRKSHARHAVAYIDSLWKKQRATASDVAELQDKLVPDVDTDPSKWAAMAQSVGLIIVAATANLIKTDHHAIDQIAASIEELMQIADESSNEQEWGSIGNLKGKSIEDIKAGLDAINRRAGKKALDTPYARVVGKFLGSLTDLVADSEISRADLWQHAYEIAQKYKPAIGSLRSST